MNETNLPEKILPEALLNSWQPRRPSATLKRRIFLQPTESSTLASRWLWGALTPTMTCLLLTVMMFNSSNSVIHQKPLMAMVLSNQNYAFCDENGGQTTQNRWASVTFDWTNHSVFNSSMGFTPTTNSSN
jgi:hypothetical protein